MPQVPSTKIATASGQKGKSNIPSCPMPKSRTQNSLQNPSLTQTNSSNLSNLTPPPKYHTKGRKHGGMIALSCNSSLLKRTEAEGSRVHQPELPKKRKWGSGNERREHKWVCSTLKVFTSEEAPLMKARPSFLICS